MKAAEEMPDEVSPFFVSDAADWGHHLLSLDKTLIFVG
jgi:hypothetical protein